VIFTPSGGGQCAKGLNLVRARQDGTIAAPEGVERPAARTAPGAGGGWRAMSEAKSAVVMPAVYDIDCDEASAADETALIAAIDAVNPTADDDVINQIAGCNYTLTAVSDLTEGQNGLPSNDSAVRTGALTINANGAAIQRVEAAEPLQRIHVAPGGDLTLNNLMLRNGSLDASALGSAELRGAVSNNGGTLTVRDSIIVGNQAATHCRCWRRPATGWFSTGPRRGRRPE
jgi:hypothetical protein